jgi:hypothetical protein
MADNFSFRLSKSKPFAFKMSLRTPGTLLKKKKNLDFFFMDFSRKFVWAILPLFGCTLMPHYNALQYNANYNSKVPHYNAISL